MIIFNFAEFSFVVTQSHTSSARSIAVQWQFRLFLFLFSTCFFPVLFVAKTEMQVGGKCST